MGINEKTGECEQLKRSVDLGFCASLVISSIVLAPFAVSVIDHSKSMFHRSLAGNLHQIQLYVEFAASSPQTRAKNFQSPPRKYWSEGLTTYN